MRRWAIAIVGTAIALLIVGRPGVAHAQSSIIGVVQDASGAVLPGVSVEAASDALIEGARRTTTGDGGQYRIVDLRPGTYVVTFSLQGFQTIKQESVELRGEFTATINATLKIASVAETIVVTAQVANVDVQNAVQVTRLNREALDQIPTGQNIWEIGQLIPGIQLTGGGANGAPTVGGSGGAVQTYMSVHGMDAAQNVVLVDGMTVSGLEFNGAIQSYFNNDNSQEMTYQTSGISADRSGGGVTVNMIPREGGNRFSGDANFNYRPGAWLGDNFSSRLSDMGAISTSGLEYLSDYTVSQGGPIKRDRLWFFTSFHQFNTSDLVPNSVNDDGSQTADGQRIIQGSVRLTYQLGGKGKLSGYFEKIDKLRTNQILTTRTDPETASIRTTSPNYSTGAVKYTSALTNRLLLEAGYSFNREFRDEFGQPGIMRERDTPEWYANASRTTVVAGGRTTAPSLASSTWPARDNLQTSLAYVTGAHNMKFGVQYQWGTNYHNSFANADLTQQYSTQTVVGNEVVFSTPVQVTVRNTPVESQDRLVHDIGIYGQDSWRMKRLTLNYGLRWESAVAQNDAYSAPAGRFVPARSVPAVENVPNFKDIAPRFSAVYDLFGNSKSALKYSANRYNRAVGTLLANTFNTLSATTRALPWTDLNGNDIAEVPSVYDANGNPTYCVYLSAGCEINLATLRSGNGTLFGTPADAAVYEPTERTWNLEQRVELEHQLTSRVTLIGSWTHGSDHDISKTINRNVRPEDYRAVQIFNPADGTPITVFSLQDAATATRINTGGASLTYTEPERQSVFNEYGIDFRLRLYQGAQIFGGWTASRTRGRDCTSSVGTASPNTLLYCDEWDLPEGLDIKLAHDFRVSGSLPLKWQGLIFGFSYLNNDEGPFQPSYSITVATTRYPDGTVASNRLISGQPAPPCPTTYGCVPGALVTPGFVLPVGSTILTVDMQPNGSQRFERLQQFDFKLSKTFKFSSVTVAPTLNVYNALNSDHIISYASLAYASNVGNYLIPNSILLGRVVGIGAQVRW